MLLALIDVWQTVFEAGLRVALAMGHALGGPEPGTRTAIAIWSALRNPGLALLVAALNGARPAATRAGASRHRRPARRERMSALTYHPPRNGCRLTVFSRAGPPSITQGVPIGHTEHPRLARAHRADGAWPRRHINRS